MNVSAAVEQVSKNVGRICNPSHQVSMTDLDGLQTRPTGSRNHYVRAALLFLLLASVLLAGCSKPTDINTTYGRRRGRAATSVNGTSVLARMFQNAGHRVVSGGRGAAQIDDCRVVVWAPNRFTPPTQSERDAIETWLTDDYGRTFIYIGRDYDAGVEYWRRGLQTGEGETDLQPGERQEYARRLAVSQSHYETARSLMPEEENATWFVARRDHPFRRVDKLSGPWSDGVDPANAEIIIRARFDIPTEQEEADAGNQAADAAIKRLEEQGYYFGDYDDAELYHDVLLAAPTGDGGDDLGDAPLVTRVSHSYWNQGAVVVVTNGSFLLNLPLVNHEHRKLAGKLIDECGYETGKVAFWEAESFEPQALAEQQGEWSVLTTWPLNIILLHLGVLGFVYVLWRFPIFGPAKDLPPTAASDFAKHINALGELMAATDEPGYARARLEFYRAHVRSDRRDSPGTADASPLTKTKSAHGATLALEQSDAMIESRNGNYDDAVRLVNRMIDEKPRQASLWQFKGQCLFKLERYDEALNCFQQVQAISGPQAEEAFLWVSHCHHNSGRLREAKDTIERFLTDPGEAHADLISKAKAALGKLQDRAAK